MKIDKNYDPQAHFVEIQQRIQTELGEPVTPSWKEVLEDWNGRAKYLTPRCFMFLVDLKLHQPILTTGMSVLGYEENWKFTGQEFIDLVHENQKKLLSYQTIKLYELFLEHPELIQNKGATYCTSRGIKDASGKYQLAYQIAFPVQYDSNGVIARYLSHYTVLGAYKGEALETNMYAAPQFQKEQKEFRKLIRGIKEHMIEGLGFTRTQKQVIDKMALKRYSKKEIAEQMEISPRTLESHKSNIIEKAKDAFPLNNFNNAEDVILYLEQQDII
ncbi:MAG: LuxR C-terminal-related transcriptional regulator [Bacteroidota bacterium]